MFQLRESEEGGLGARVGLSWCRCEIGRERKDWVIFVLVIVSRGIHSPVTIMFVGNIYFTIRRYFWEKHFLCEI